MSHSANNAALQLPTGCRLEHYELNATLGAGSFGVTYRAYTQRFREDCVIKELLPVDFATRAPNSTEVIPLQQSCQYDLAKCRRDFEREAMVLQQVDHPNVVKILDFFEANSTSYMVMPFAEGCDYEAHLQQLGRAPTEEEILQLLHPALDGLEAVHALGYLHRDLKPQNILITRRGAPLIIDFGAARQAIGSRSRQISTILTPRYAPFEQYSSSMEQGPYTDLYSMAAVAYRAMVGEAPVEAPNRMSPSKPDPYQPLVERLAGRYSRGLLEALDWALRRSADDRPQNVADWRRQLPVLNTTPGPTGDVVGLSGDILPPKTPTAAKTPERVVLPPSKPLIRPEPELPSVLHPTLPHVPQIPFGPLSQQVSKLPSVVLFLAVLLGAIALLSFFLYRLLSYMQE